MYLHPLTEAVWAAMGTKQNLDSRRKNKGKLDNWLSMYHRDDNDEALAAGLASAWKTAIWVGQCGQCGMETWTQSLQDVRRLTNAPCANCGDVVIPF